MKNNWIKVAAILGALGVGLGAFGAHALKDMLAQNEMTETFKTAVNYHFYHVFALLFTAILTNEHNFKTLRAAAYVFIIGIALFSGSLYAMCFTGIKMLGIITPLGGLAFIAGWLLLFWSFHKKPTS